jgi:N-formylglutamate amidohydrolase
MKPRLETFSLTEIHEKLEKVDLPVSGITELGSSEFHILEPANHIGLAVHAGHLVRPGIQEVLAVTPGDRLREEDPHTEMFITAFPIQIIARDSRYEYDVNWEVEKAIYGADGKKWGFQVWKRELTASERRESLDKFHEIHALIEMVTEFILKQHQMSMIFDMHSFCYQREKRQNWFRDDKPDINLGTQAVRRDQFSVLIDKLLEMLAATNINGHSLRVAENEIFPGGYLSRKYSRMYPDRVLVLSLEYKKLFMDEWTGELYPDLLQILVNDFESMVRQLIPFSLKY